MQLPNKSDKTGGTGDVSLSSQTSNGEPDFAEFMWMANEDLEAFDEKVISELDETLGLATGRSTPDPEEQEKFLNSMLEEEEKDTVYFDSVPNESVEAITNQLNQLDVSPPIAESRLNPLAAEFVPSGGSPSFSPSNVVHVPGGANEDNTESAVTETIT